MSRQTPPTPSPAAILAHATGERDRRDAAAEARQAEIAAHLEHVAALRALAGPWDAAADRLDAALAPVFARSDSREAADFARHAPAVAAALRGVGDQIRAHDDSPAASPESGPTPAGHRPRSIRWRLADLGRPEVLGALSQAPRVAMQAVWLAADHPDSVEALLMTEPAAGWLPAVVDLLGPTRTGPGRGPVAPRAPRALPAEAWDTSPMGSDDWYRASWLLANVQLPAHVGMFPGGAEVGPDSWPLAESETPAPVTPAVRQEVGVDTKAPEVRPDGPDDDGKTVWFGGRSAELTPVPFLVLKYMWARRSATYDELAGHVNENRAEDASGSSFHTWTHRVNADLTCLSMPRKLSASRVGRVVTWKTQPTPPDFHGESQG